MDFDDDVVPLMQKLDAVLLRMRSELLPLLASLNEDVLVTNYSVDEQARISLAAAFVLVLLTYAYDRLQNAVGKTGVDARVQLKLDRVSGYIKKLREITHLDSRQQDGTTAAAAAVSGKATRKRGRVETHDSNAELHKARDASAVDDPYGDAILFTEIERGAGKTVSSSVQNLLRQVKDSSTTA
ncbi:exosome-associated protein 3 [Trypanosoma rangeli]|uniref:Exosome-associated protein 3 n=1 Tax=Trypanosoma rangeli TaxID=5698 RepID=A0A3R7KNC7_TRYRA|nr:exosome-associated protein 3 [Trypanosoma rangeli]RNF10823.1 exosome-associated protein 3 [Trypanosoma rangeli]|eukprot:RNF10823.1 exosome-associated protein 3 [Trypanosoma rangeli]